MSKKPLYENARERAQFHCPASAAAMNGLNRQQFLKLVMTGFVTFCLPPASGFANVSFAANAPKVVRKSPQNEANPVRLSDGTLAVYYMELNSHVESIKSVDHGLTWSDPQFEFAVSGETAYACRALTDRDGEVHIWFVQRGKNNSVFPGDRHLDIWHNQTINGQSEWGEQHLVWEGYCGAIRGALQMDNGRMIVPFGAWKTGDEDLPNNTGSNYTTVIYSEDNGATWQQSPAALTSPVYENYNGNNYGACEPCITQLSDGRLWMLIRTQTGVLYESFSRNGVNWTEAAPTRFSSSNSPAAFVKPDDERIIVLWNNHELPPRVNGDGVYGGRDALHAAISDDDGQTWRGFREVYLDPTRHESPPKSGDRGTAYPNGEATNDEHIMLVTGQAANARAIIRFHSDWLYETSRLHDFTLDGLENWSVYKGIGSASGWWRDRVAGSQLVPHPDKIGSQVLHIRRSEQYDADGATWNFPKGRQGVLNLQFRVNEGFKGAQISLADRLFDPTDDQGERLSIFQFIIDTEGYIEGCNANDGKFRIIPGHWHSLAFHWHLDQESCDLRIDGQSKIRIDQATSTMNGISYLRLRSTADTIDHAGIMVETADVEVEKNNPLSR